MSVDCFKVEWHETDWFLQTEISNCKWSVISKSRWQVSFKMWNISIKEIRWLEIRLISFSPMMSHTKNSLVLSDLLNHVVDWVAIWALYLLWNAARNEIRITWSIRKDERILKENRNLGVSSAYKLESISWDGCIVWKPWTKNVFLSCYYVGRLRSDYPEACVDASNHVSMCFSLRSKKLRVRTLGEDQCSLTSM